MRLSMSLSAGPTCNCGKCSQDVVTREGKLIFMYKRPGQRVIVNAAGHMMVRPTHIEASVQKATGGGLYTPLLSALKSGPHSSWIHHCKHIPLTCALGGTAASSWGCSSCCDQWIADSSPVICKQ